MDRTGRAARDARIIQLDREGCTTRQNSERVGESTRTVRRVLCAYEKAQAATA